MWGQDGLTHNCALCRSVTPRLVVRREYAQVASTNELLIVHAQDGVVAVQEVWVEDDLDAVMRVVEQLDTSNLVENWIVVVIGHVMCRYGREGVALQNKNATFQQNLVFFRQQIVGCRKSCMFSG